MSNGDDIAWAIKDVGFPEFDTLFAAFGELGRANDDEHRVIVDFELGSLMSSMCVFDGQVVESECLLDVSENLLAGLV